MRTPAILRTAATGTTARCGDVLARARLMKTLRIGALALCGALAAASSFAQSPAAVASVDPLDLRLKHLELELRCLVCQNQTLADSDAPLAADLRREVRELALAGKSDDDIRAYLTARYGDFVLYDPPVQPNTWLLWFGPGLLLAAGALAWWRMGRPRADDTGERASTSDEADALRGRALLKE